MEKEQLFEVVEEERERLATHARQIWETPEVAMSEYESSRYLADVLEREGFDVEMGVGELETAFVGSYGTGGPTVGLVGEYDALPGLSQAVAAERRPVEEGAPGHGCGHNLHGVGAVGGAIAVKRAIEEGALEGTIEFYGCPAEEGGIGKMYMARAGVFDDLDAAIAWHPDNVSTVRLGTANAKDGVEYTFTGGAAHAAASPESGRSALDAVQLMNLGVEHVREHVPTDARIHYVITDGGEAPNVVPERASVWYYVRSPSRESLEPLADWVDDVAEGAALMTGTEVDRTYISGCHSYLPNETVGMRVWENMARVGPIDYTDDDRSFAGDLRATIPEDDVEARLDKLPDEVKDEVREHDLYAEPIEPFDRGDRSAGSADLAEVCWNVPTVQFRGAVWPVGTAAHTWQAVAANGGYGTKAVAFAAKVFAGTVHDLFSDPSVLEAAWDEFEDATGGEAYESPLPDDAGPPNVAHRNR